VEGTVTTLLDALRGHAGTALIIALCVILSLTARAPRSAQASSDVRAGRGR
jgi:hypothetical protein